LIPPYTQAPNRGAMIEQGGKERNEL